MAWPAAGASLCYSTAEGIGGFNGSRSSAERCRSHVEGSPCWICWHRPLHLQWHALQACLDHAAQPAGSFSDSDADGLARRWSLRWLATSVSEGFDWIFTVFPWGRQIASGIGRLFLQDAIYIIALNHYGSYYIYIYYIYFKIYNLYIYIYIYII